MGRKKYKRLALQFHPDKLRSAKSKGKSMTPEEAAAKFSSISQAHAVLSNPLKRIVYDLQLGVRDKTDKEIVKMSEMKRQQALQDISNMKCTVPIKRAQEEARNGLVIINAVYSQIKKSKKKAKKAKKKRRSKRRASLSTLNEDSASKASMDA